MKIRNNRYRKKKENVHLSDLENADLSKVRKIIEIRETEVGKSSFLKERASLCQPSHQKGEAIR
jgi:hypothetical protein